MGKLAELIIKCKGAILVLFIALSAVSAFYATRVKTNFDLFSYVPKKAASTIAIETMADEYDQDIPNVEIGVPDLSISQALNFKEKLAALPYVKEVLWLNDQVDLATPIELLDRKIVEGFYKDGMALYHLTVDEEAKAQDVLGELQELAGPEGAVRGQVVEMANMQQAITLEITRIIMIAVHDALLILMIATKSCLNRSVYDRDLRSVLLNMGFQHHFQSVFFITQAVASILQLAVSWTTPSSSCTVSVITGGWAFDERPCGWPLSRALPPILSRP